MYVANLCALCHLPALYARLSLAVRACPLDCGDLFLVCQNVKTTSLPTAVSYVFQEPHGAAHLAYAKLRPCELACIQPRQHALACDQRVHSPACLPPRQGVLLLHSLT